MYLYHSHFIVFYWVLVDILNFAIACSFLPNWNNQNTSVFQTMRQETHIGISDFCVFLSSFYPPFPSSLSSPLFSFFQSIFLFSLFSTSCSLSLPFTSSFYLSSFGVSSATSDHSYAQLHVQKRSRSTAEYGRQKQ